MPFIQYRLAYDDIISIENLLEAWNEFLKGKRGKKDVHHFQLHLYYNISRLHDDLKSGAYKHGGYEALKINDPKPRDIHKASVRDRLLHHAIYRKLYPFFDKFFIADSYSCRNDKGTHRSINRFRVFNQRASFNNTKTVWILKCDVKKFFASIDHKMMVEIIDRYISDKDIIRLLVEIINSFHSNRVGVGLPLGNLTSQLFVNMYMNEFDQYVKHGLRQKYYIRYADDFVIMHHDRGVLMEILPKVDDFLKDHLKLSLHPNKVFINTASSGIDFLGWVHFPDHRVLRTSTKRRIQRALARHPKPETVESYKGMLMHGNTHKLRKSLGLN